MYLLLHSVLLCLLPVNGLISWNSLDVALTQAKEKTVPVLFLMTKSTCKPCNKLSEELDKSFEFGELSKSFILAKANDNELPSDDKFGLDGKYVPKIVFLNHFGNIIKSVVNVDAKSDKAKYFYSKVEHVLKSMNKSLETANLDNGFGKDYIWYSWENGLNAAKDEDKPILLVFHQDWCGACARLKPKFAESTEVKELASKFILINTDNEDIVKADKYKADGEYYPKILFLDSNAELIEDEWNHGTKHSHVKHYYGDGAEISVSMKRVLGNRTKVEKVEDKGFGSHIKWVKYANGLALSKENNKPMMLIIHKSYCGACKALKPRIRNHAEIGELSKQFVMVHCEDDEEPLDDQFDQDGAYIPRIFFLDNLGRVEPSLKCDEVEFKDTAYAYGSAASILKSMHKAIEMNLGNRKLGEKVKISTPAKTEEKKAEEPKEDAGFPGLRFGPEIKWFDYEEGLREAKKSHKASMLVFYNDYCQFSSFMVKQIHENEKIVQLAKKFVMINIVEEKMAHIPDKEKFNIDGTYTPRIIFMDPDQNIYTDINNTDTAYPSTMFYYGDGETISTAMSTALVRINLTLGNGFGEYIEWVRFEKSFEIANETNIPIMLIIHKTWCGACSALKPVIEYSRPIWEMSVHFIMVNVEDDAEPLDNQYFVDGGYYPRIFFIDPQGQVDKTLHNRDPSYLKHKYSYGNEDHILMTMKFAAHKYTSRRYQPIAAVPTETVEETTQTQTTESTIDTTNMSPGKKLLASSGASFMNIYEATELTKVIRKPILFLIHRTTCPSCKALIKSISRDKEFKTKTAPFILADIEDDVDEKKADSYDIDGGYVPRIYFLDPEGEVMAEIWNIGTNYITSKFYYYDMTSVYRGMDRALKHMETWLPGQNKKQTTDNKKKDEL